MSEQQRLKPLPNTGARPEVEAEGPRPVRNRKVKKRQLGVRLIAVGVVVLCALLVGFNLVVKPMLVAKMFSGRERPPAMVTAMPIQPMVWTPAMEAVGTATAANGVDLAVDTGGRITQLGFKANDRATAGQVLVQIDDSAERADMIAAQARITLSESQLARANNLRTKGVNSQASLDDARAQLDMARSTFARLSAVTELKAIKAPFDGVVGVPRVDVGQYVSPGTIVVTIQDLDSIRVDFTVPEQLASLIALGATAHFGANSESLEFKGRITGIDPKVDPATRLVLGRAELDNSQGKVRPGQFLRVRIDLPTQDNVIAIPETAVVPSLYGAYVYLAMPAEGKEGAARDKQTLVAKQSFVKTGQRNGAMIQILSGITAGDIVVTSGQNKLRNGAPVTIDQTTDPRLLPAGNAGEHR